MKLKDYLDEYGVKICFLAEKTGLNHGTLLRARDGENVIIGNCYLISKATRGVVSLEDLVPEQYKADEAKHEKRTKNTKKDS